MDKICKKIFICFLLVAIFNLLVGCYSSELLTVPEYNQIEDEDRPDEMLVISKDGQEYHFAESKFYFESDTLYGMARVKGLPFEGKFAFEEIESIQFKVVGQNFTSIHSVSQYQKIEAESGKPDEIYLINNDFTRYQFMKNDYYIENDTLYGKGKLMDGEELLDGKIALSDIESIQYEYLNVLTTTAFVFGVVVFTLFVQTM